MYVTMYFSKPTSCRQATHKDIQRCEPSTRLTKPISTTASQPDSTTHAFFLDLEDRVVGLWTAHFDHRVDEFLQCPDHRITSQWATVLAIQTVTLVGQASQIRT